MPLKSRQSRDLGLASPDGRSNLTLRKARRNAGSDCTREQYTGLSPKRISATRIFAHLLLNLTLAHIANTIKPLGVRLATRLVPAPLPLPRFLPRVLANHPLVTPRWAICQHTREGAFAGATHAHELARNGDPESGGHGTRILQWVFIVI